MSNIYGGKINSEKTTIYSLIIYSKITIPFSRTGTQSIMYFCMLLPWFAYFGCQLHTCNRTGKLVDVKF